jgi:hypothetical protein
MRPVFKNASISPRAGIDAAASRRVTEIALAAVANRQKPFGTFFKTSFN